MKKAPKFKKITAEELQKLLTESAGAILVDTLPAEVYAKRHIPESKNACVYEVVFPDQVRELAPRLDQDIIVYGSARFFEHLGMHLVFDPVSIEVRIVAR